MSNRQAKRFRMCVKGREMPDGKGGTKNHWAEIGQLTVFADGPVPEGLSFAIEVNHMPGAQVNAFEIQPRQQQQQQGGYQQQPPVHGGGF